MAQATIQTLNYLRQALASAHAVGSNTLIVSDGAAWGAPTPAAPLIATAFYVDDPGVPIFNARITGRSGNQLTIGAITWGVDLALGVGDIVALTPAAELFDELRNAVNSKTDTGHDHDDRYYIDAEVDAALAGKANVSHSHPAADITSGVLAPARLATGTPDATNYVRGDGTWAVVPLAAHDHDERYYLEAEVDAALAGKANVSHAHAAADITSGVIAPARLATGTPDATNYVRGDGTWAAGPVGPQGEQGIEGPPGPQGTPGEGVPAGGATGQVLAKASATDYDTAWVDQTGGGGLADGDKGEITVTSGGTVWTIDDGVVTPAKLSGLVPIAQGGTGGGTAAEAQTNLEVVPGMHVQAWDSALDAIAALPVDKGNLIVASGVVWDRLPVGMNGAVLKADSSRATGLRWTIGGNVLVWFTSLTSIAVTNTTTESSLIPTSLSGTKTVEPAQMVVGDIVRLEMCGTCTTLAATPGNATFRWKVNGVTLAAAGPHALPTNNALYYFRVSAVFIIRATGAGGSVGGSMEIQLPNGASNTATFRHAHSSGGPVSVDLSGGATIDLTLQMTVADAGNNFTASMVSLKQERAYNLP